jgi:hypothetical protein
MRGDDRPHRVGDDVHPLDPEALHDQARLLDEERQREGRLDPVRACRSGKVEANAAMTRERRQHRCEGIGAAAEAVEHEHGFALALRLDGHALDEHCHLPV